MFGLKAGTTTTEFLVSKSASRWGIVAMILGVAVTGGSAVGGVTGGSTSTVGIIVGAIISLAGIVQKMLTDIGYIKSRTKIKDAVERRLAEEARNKGSSSS